MAGDGPLVPRRFKTIGSSDPAPSLRPVHIQTSHDPGQGSSETYYGN